MNKLSKVLVLILITMLFIGCVKKHRRSHTYYIINETEKSFYVHVDYDEKEIYETRSIYIEGKTEEPILLFTKSGIVLECSSCSYYPASPDQYSEIWFYNIADTSSVNFWELFYSDVMLDDQLRTSIYKTGGECRETERDIDNEYLFRCIHITDEFLDLFEKDYSMLDKFTEYYP